MAKLPKRKESSGDRFRNFTGKILIVFSAVILIVTALLDFVVLELSGNAMKTNASNLIAADSRQLQLNINSYLERTETISTLLFSDEAYYLYDETADSLSDYDKIKNEELIRNRIVDIGLMENYADFGIIYPDDHKVGWISHGTEDLFPNGGFYETFSGYISNQRKKDGWCFGLNGNIDRMYYIKRLNPNAILVSSIYTRELSSVFIHPEQLEDMTIRLVNQDDIIMFSSQPDEIGQSLPEEIIQRLADRTSRADSDYILNSNTCSNNWRVICSIPTESILRENIRLRRITLWISVSLAALVLVIGLSLITRLSRPMDGIVTSLQTKAEIDRLSGVMNKATFQEATSERLSLSPENRSLVFVMLDVDNFKQINDKLGHAYGDEVIIRVGKLLRRLFDSQTIIGRLGGDEFALFTECYDIEKNEVIRAAEEQISQVLDEFLKEFAVEREQCGISLSAGLFITEAKEISFETLYKKADSALYRSKQSGKSRYTLDIDTDSDKS